MVSAYVVYSRWQETMKPQPPPVVQSRVIPGGPAPTRFAPEMGVLLEGAGALNLTPQQQSKLRALTEDWRRFSGPLKRELDNEATKFREFAEEEAKSGKGNLVELQRRAEPVSQFSREYGNLKLEYWERAMQILTPSQRKRAEELRQRALRPQTPLQGSRSQPANTVESS